MANFLRTIRRHVLVAGLCTGAGVFATCIILASMADYYRAEARITPLKGRQQIELGSMFFGLDILRDLVGASLPATYESFSAMKVRAILKSRHFNLLMVEKYDLLPILYKDYWDTGKKQWIASSRPKSQRGFFHRLVGLRESYYVLPPSPTEGADLLARKLRVSKYDRQTDWIQIDFEDEDPEFAVAMVYRYLQELDMLLREEAIRRATDNQLYLEELIRSQPDEGVRERLKLLRLTQMEQAVYAGARSAFLFEVIDLPILPEFPAGPNRTLIFLLGLLAAVLFGCVMPFVWERINVHRSRCVHQEGGEDA